MGRMFVRNSHYIKSAPSRTRFEQGNDREYQRGDFISVAA